MRSSEEIDRDVAAVRPLADAERALESIEGGASRPLYPRVEGSLRRLALLEAERASAIEREERDRDRAQRVREANELRQRGAELAEAYEHELPSRIEAVANAEKSLAELRECRDELACMGGGVRWT